LALLMTCPFSSISRALAPVVDISMPRNSVMNASRKYVIGFHYREILTQISQNCE
jgi:hypothetical protein